MSEPAQQQRIAAKHRSIGSPQRSRDAARARDVITKSGPDRRAYGTIAESTSIALANLNDEYCAVVTTDTLLTVAR